MKQAIMYLYINWLTSEHPICDKAVLKLFYTFN